MRLALALLCVLAASATGPQPKAEGPTHEGRPLTEWISDLSSADVLQRWAAQRAIGDMGEAAIPGLLAAIPEADATMRVALLMTLDSICCDKAAALPTLRPLLKDADGSVRVAAAASMTLIERPLRPEALAVLIEALDSPDGHEAWASAFALRRLGPNAEPAVPALIRALRHADEDARLAAAFALGEIGPSAAAAIPALEQVLAGSDEPLKQNAGLALKSIRGK